MNWSYFVLLPKSDLKMFQGLERVNRGQFVRLKLGLSCSFRYDQIYNNHGYDLGYDLVILYFVALVVQQTHLKGLKE